MASTINATTSGVVTTGDTVATLSLQTSGVNAVSVDTSQNVTLSKSLIISGSTSGNVTFTANAISGTQSYTLPPALPASSGYALTSTTGGVMTWAASGGGSPGGSTTQVQYNNSGAFGGISGFTTDGTRVTASTTIGVGGATPSTSGVGITFPSAKSLSSNANTLDDYEEGTWTPSLNFGGATTGITYSTRTARYVKVGNLVYIDLFITLSSKGSATGSALITNLPFSSANENPLVFIFNSNGVQAANGFIYGLAFTTTLYLRVATTTAQASLTDTNFNNNSQFQLCGTFSI